MKKIFKNKKGFTLMEIIVVLIIIAVLAAALIPSFVRFAQNARASSAIAEAQLGMTAAQAVVTEILASGHVLDANPDAQIRTYTVGGVNRFSYYLRGDVSNEAGFSGITMDPGGTRVNGITYAHPNYNVVVDGVNGSTTATPVGS